MYYENFEKLCALNKVKPSHVSKATGISTATLTSWKQGKYTPKNDKLQKIADYFGVSIDYIVNGNEKADSNGYYLDGETAATAQEMFEKDKILFDVYRSTDKDRLIAYAKRLKELREMEEGDI